MKKYNGELSIRDLFLLCLITVITFLLPPLLFQPRKNTPAPKVQRKPSAVIVKSDTFSPPGLQDQFYYHDPEVFLNGDDAHTFAFFRIREHNPEYLLKQLGSLPELETEKVSSMQPGKLPGSTSRISAVPLREPYPVSRKSVTDSGKTWNYPMLFSPDGLPLPDCRINAEKNAEVPGKPTKLQINVPLLNEMETFVHVEIVASCGNKRMDRIAQREVNRYLLSNSRFGWKHGMILTVYWGQNVTVAPAPEETQTEGKRS